MFHILAWLLCTPLPPRTSIMGIEYEGFFKNYLFIYLWVALGPYSCKQSFFSCSAHASHCGGFSLRSMGSRQMGFSSCSAWAQELWCIGWVAPRHVGSFWVRQIHIHCTTREVWECGVFKWLFLLPLLLLVTLALSFGQGYVWNSLLRFSNDPLVKSGICGTRLLHGDGQGWGRVAKSPQEGNKILSNICT